MTERVRGLTRRRRPVAGAVSAALLCILGVLLPEKASGQTIYPIANCVEYQTNAPYYIPHFGYLSTETSAVTIPTGQNNFFNPVSSPQFTTFYPGYYADISVAASLPYVLYQNWLVDGHVADVAPPPAYYARTVAETEITAITPACDPTISPAAPNFTSTGTYTHQLLAQVNAGPRSTADAALAATALVAPGSNLTVSNLQYVPADPAGAGLNPNSIYGDITVSGNVTGASTPVLLQLTVGGVVVVSGAVSITH